MRAVFPNDLDRATQAVMAQSCERQEQYAKSLVWRAHVADKYRKRLGRVHPQLGSGTLSSAVSSKVKSHPDRCSSEYLCALKCVIIAIIEK